MPDAPTVLDFDKGTLILSDASDALRSAVPDLRWDKRTRHFRAPACRYREIVLALHHAGLPWEDRARGYARLTGLSLKTDLRPRPYQAAAMQAWRDSDMRGVVCLPTGAGKTILAVLLIAEVKRPALIHVPTIDLMHQWHSVLTTHLGGDIGLLGGGYKELRDITVTTYDSALLHATARGNRFGFAIFDECHHLPGDQYRFAAISSIAPFRLGLTATPERTDGLESRLDDLVGPICYQADIRELRGSSLASYRVETLPMELSESERSRYESERGIYLDFLRRERINLGHRNGWNQFLWRSSQSPEGRRAFQAYLAQKRLSQAAEAKLAAVWELLRRHRGDRLLVFTQDNDMAYRIGTEFLLPVLTHQTRVKEREAFLDAFREGRLPVLVTSKVLNEGVDVPEANVAVVVSGSGSVREHVQRLGRILRPRPGKEAVLYELVTRGTGEHFVNQRRRQHRAYQDPDSP